MSESGHQVLFTYHGPCCMKMGTPQIIWFNARPTKYPCKIPLTPIHWQMGGAKMIGTWNPHMDALMNMTKFGAPIQFWPKNMWFGEAYPWIQKRVFFFFSIESPLAYISACRIPWRCHFYAILYTHKIAGFDVENIQIIHDSAHEPCGRW